MESIEKLRDELSVCGCDPDECMGCDVPRKVREGLQAIEREIDERYMKLPVDADGVPIRVGDIVQQSNGWKKEVLGIGAGCFYDRHYLDDYHKHYAVEYSHIKKDPVKELLEELVAKVENDVNWRCNASDEIDCMTARIREAVEK